MPRLRRQEFGCYNKRRVSLTITISHPHDEQDQRSSGERMGSLYRADPMALLSNSSLSRFLGRGCVGDLSFPTPS